MKQRSGRCRYLSAMMSLVPTRTRLWLCRNDGRREDLWGIISELVKRRGRVGAVDIAELTPEDWERLPSYTILRPLELRRLAAITNPVATKLEP